MTARASRLFCCCLLILPIVVAAACGGREAGEPSETAARDSGATRSPDAGAAGVENTNELCSDGVSNDGDNFVDCDDYDCSRSTAVTVCGSGSHGGHGGTDGGAGGGAENTNELCSDGESNDGDRYVDCDDYDCSRNAAVTVCR